MKAYLIKIDSKEVEEWNKETGTGGNNDRWTYDLNLEKVIKVDKLTRKDILNAVTDMINHRGKVTEDDLFDANEDYYIFSRLENNNAEELTENTNGYYVSYIINIYEYNRIKADNIK